MKNNIYFFAEPAPAQPTVEPDIEIAQPITEPSKEGEEWNCPTPSVEPEPKA